MDKEIIRNIFNITAEDLQEAQTVTNAMVDYLDKSPEAEKLSPAQRSVLIAAALIKFGRSKA